MEKQQLQSEGLHTPFILFSPYKSLFLHSLLSALQLIPAHFLAFLFRLSVISCLLSRILAFLPFLVKNYFFSLGQPLPPAININLVSVVCYGQRDVQYVYREAFYWLDSYIYISFSYIYIYTGMYIYFFSIYIFFYFNFVALTLSYSLPFPSSLLLARERMQWRAISCVLMGLYLDPGSLRNNGRVEAEEATTPREFSFLIFTFAD